MPSDLKKPAYLENMLKAEAEALADVLASNAQDLSTKTDIALIHSEMREMRTEINGELKLLRWMVGMSIALSTGTIALLAKLVFILPH